MEEISGEGEEHGIEPMKSATVPIVHEHVVTVFPIAPDESGFSSSLIASILFLP